MAKVTDEHHNLIDTPDTEIPMSESDLNRIFDLAVKIDQIKVEYDNDPLKMANNAIRQMRGYASEIASKVGHKLI